MKAKKGHVEIAGAGIAGLTAAAAFAQAGWSVRVHERGDELREIGAGIFMWENALRVLEAIGAYDDAIGDGEKNNYWEIRDEQSRLLQSGWMMEGARLYTVLRAKLHKALANAALSAGAEILTNSRVAGATADGELILECGKRYQADVVVGADGVNSVVRNAVGLTRKFTDLEDGCGRYLIPRYPSDDINGKSLEYWSGGRRVGIVPADKEHIYVYACCPAADVEGRISPPDPEVWSKSFPELRKYFGRITNNGRWAGFADVTTTAWSRGRVAVIGDASHAMSPNLGQGAAVSMQSGYLLAKELSRGDDVEASLLRWENKFRPIAEATQRFSRIYGRVGTRWPRTLLPLRSAVVWGIGKSSMIQRKVNVAAHADVTAPTF